jgi:endonuclease I
MSMGKPFQFSYHGRNTSLILLIIMATSTLSLAGIPSGYYDGASGKSGSILKSALNDIIDGHTEYPYTSSGTDVWDILKVSDRDPNNSSNVICIYTQYSIDAAQEYNSGAGWSREHVWAKSHGDFGTATGAGTDIHNLKPEDVSVNSTRNNKDFDDGGTLATDNSPPSGYDGTLDCYTTSYTWEPPDGVKGDVARIIFYMVTRYEGENSEVDLEMVDYADSAPSLEPYHGVESTLLSWHIADPVDSFEHYRNEVIYGYQGNRNPFIDHPEYVNAIWGDEEEGGDLIITGIYDGPLSGGTPKGVELYVLNNISDLSIYGIGSATNGGGTDGQEYTFPAEAATAGDYLYITYEITQFANWFGFASDYTTGAVGVNGDDAIELFYDGAVVDVFGDITKDGTGEVWEYLDGWAYSKDDRSRTTSFSSGDWTYSGTNALDGETTNATAGTQVPVGTFSTTDSPLPVELSLWTATSDRGEVKLLWTTDSEIENQGFVIERIQKTEDRSQNVWKEITSFTTNPDLLGQGSTPAQSNYSFIDKQVQVGRTYGYGLSDVDYRGHVTRHSEIRVTVKNSEVDLKPSDVQLHKAFPNPFNPDVNLSFTTQQEAEMLSLEIYDIRGVLIKTLSSGYHEMGSHEIMWSGMDGQGNAVSSGVYLVRLSAGSVNQIQRVTLLK